ncbi:tyrosine recombinase XerC [Fodinicola feengrottensis]|uniref:Tyrosine recombinase XerC n=2 Tax=Fodinicola feengrottensis TaxID=435914 RepID=A0ABN2IBH5_9ACTN
MERENTEAATWQRRKNDLAGSAANDYFRALRMQRLSTNTIYGYRQGLRKLSKFAESVGTTLDALTTEQIECYQETRGELGLADCEPSSAFWHLGIGVRYYRWLQRRHLRDDNPFDDIVMPKVPKAVPHPMPEPSIMRALEAAPPRIRICIAMARGCGARADDIARCRIEDLEREAENPTAILRGKSKTRHVPLTPWLLDEIERYLNTLPIEHRTRGPLIRSRVSPYGSIGRNYISKQCGAFFRDQGVSQRLHGLRHSFCTTLRQGGADAFTISEAAGHESVRTSQIYTQIAQTEVRAAMLLAQPQPLGMTRPRDFELREDTA